MTAILRMLMFLLCLGSACAQEAGNTPSGAPSASIAPSEPEAHIAPDPLLGTPEPPPADASLAIAPGQTRLETPLDAADIESRIDKGLTAAGEAPSIAPDLAYGAFQRGYFLTAFSLALDRAKTGDAVAQTLLGEILSRGLGVQADPFAAADWYGLAAKNDDPEAMYALGRLYLEGRGVKQDDAKAADLFERAAKSGHAVAAREFAYLLLQGKGRDKNAMLAAAYMRQAAGKGDMDAQYALGGLYVEGVGVVADEKLAARWYADAARSGQVEAEVEYAIMVFNGHGVAKDESIAAKWFELAANADNPVAQVRLARLYVEGRGVGKDSAAAARWYVIAKSRGLTDDYLDTWLSHLDAKTLADATEAARRWARFTSRPIPPAGAQAAAMDNRQE